MILINLLFGMLWIGLTGNPSLLNFLLGLVLGFLALRVTSGTRQRTTYFQKVPATIWFALFFMKELVISSFRVAHDIVTKRLYMRPAIIAIPLDAKSDVEITLIGCMVSLTPGTLTLDISEDRKTLFVHTMFVGDYQATIDSIKRGYERRLLSLLR